MVRFRAFVRRFLVRELKPLDRLEDTSVETWLERTTYPAWRKAQLRLVAEDAKDHKQIHECKSFVKDENYSEYKHARTINPRGDDFKVLTGPIFALIEKAVFQMDCFVKKIPVADRPAYIMKHVYGEGAVYGESDFTTFEASFKAQVMRVCEMELYFYMSQCVEGGDAWFKLVERVLTGPQLLKFFGVRVKTKATRCSGDMCTSLGNGWTNKCLFEFAAEEEALGAMRGVFEGDDGLVTFESGRLPSSEFFASLGFNVKMVRHENITSASFCGIVFDTTERVNITDPKEFLADLGWGSRQYRGASRHKKLALLRAKALSAAHQYPGCPVVEVAARRIIDLTRSVDCRWVTNSRNLSGWERDHYLEAFASRLPKRETGYNSRLLMETVFNVTVLQQLEWEATILSSDLGDWDIDLGIPLWYENFDRYVTVDTPKGMPLFPALVEERRPTLDGNSPLLR